MNSFKQRVKLSCAAIGLVCFALVANAQEQFNDTCKEQVNKQECRQNNRAKFQAMRETKWHDELKITAAQESAWKNFTESLNQLHRPDKMKGEGYGKRSQADFEKMPAPERLKNMLAKMEKRQAALKAHLVTLEALYSTLTPEQRTVLNKRLLELHQRQHKHESTRTEQMGDE